MVLQQPMFPAKMTLAEVAVTRNALGLGVAVCEGAADLFGWHSRRMCVANVVVPLMTTGLVDARC